MSPDLRGIARARRPSRETMGNIKQNLLFAFANNAAGVPIAAGGPFPVFGLLLSRVSCRHELQLGVGRGQRAALARSENSSGQQLTEEMD